MSYRAGTILIKKELVEDDNEQAPYNEIEIIGQSESVGAVRAEEWSGQKGELILVRPTDFGAVIECPMGELERDYEIVSAPDAPTLSGPTFKLVEPGPSPEDIFSAQGA